MILKPRDLRCVLNRRHRPSDDLEPLGRGSSVSKNEYRVIGIKTFGEKPVKFPKKRAEPFPQSTVSTTPRIAIWFDLKGIRDQDGFTYVSQDLTEIAQNSISNFTVDAVCVRVGPSGRFSNFSGFRCLLQLVFCPYLRFDRRRTRSAKSRTLMIPFRSDAKILPMPIGKESLWSPAVRAFAAASKPPSKRTDSTQLRPSVPIND